MLWAATTTGGNSLVIEAEIAGIPASGMPVVFQASSIVSLSVVYNG
jgi:hypothetical protein